LVKNGIFLLQILRKNWSQHWFFKKHAIVCQNWRKSPNYRS
jgi:hypothetical protein